MSEKEKNTAAAPAETGENTALTTQRSDYLAPDTANFAERVSEELAGFDATFDVIRLTNNATEFTLPFAEDAPVKTFTGVILHQHAVRGYYEKDYDGASNPPNCGSLDGKIGIGNPSGKCETCPLNEFKTNKAGGNGKACREHRRLYVLMPRQIFPVMFSVPPTSLKAFACYLKMNVSEDGLFPEMYATDFSLKHVTPQGKKAYNQVVCVRSKKPLSPKERELTSGLSAQIKSYANSVAVEFDECVDPETGEILG